LRTPLTLISAPVDAMVRDPELVDEKSLKMIQRNSRKLLKLINQLLDLSKIEAGKLELGVSMVDVIPLIKRVIMSFESLAQQKDIKLNFQSSLDGLKVFIDQEKFEDVLVNLVSNALKFTPEGGEVVVGCKKTDSHLEIRISDTGIGIAPEQLPFIFDRFFQADHSDSKHYQGTGIGLSVAKEYVELHHGNIAAGSEPGKGTIFTIQLPLGKDHFREEQIRNIHLPKDIQPILEEAEAEIGEEDPQISGTLPIILLAEDNRDMRDYISGILSEYRVITAENGKIALDKAIKDIPDLILSDVMMPEMDGVTLCKKLRADHRTDHIPIILLTAKASEKDKLEGLSVEADDYMTKPFKQEELELKIRNLIRSQKRMRDKFIENVQWVPEVTDLKSRDEVFVKDVMGIVEENISNELFGVQELAEALAMSKSQLNRKLNALLSQTPNQFIRKYRLERGRQLLEKNTGTVSEISFQVGFSSPAYFSKCFHDEFGFTPKTVKSEL
jgi:DNA-binding response OmpR family regulator